MHTFPCWTRFADFVRTRTCKVDENLCDLTFPPINYYFFHTSFFFLPYECTSIKKERGGEMSKIWIFFAERSRHSVNCGSGADCSLYWAWRIFHQFHSDELISCLACYFCNLTSAHFLWVVTVARWNKGYFSLIKEALRAWVLAFDVAFTLISFVILWVV